jgi:hypothetical protein
MDETPDEEFYRTPRLVTHIDERAIAAVTQLYRELFPGGEEVLDLMSSWDQPPAARDRVPARDRAGHERGGAAAQREARLLTWSKP